MPKLPESIRRGLTGRRVRSMLRKPLSILENVRLHMFVESSEEEHIFVVGPPRSGTTLVMSILSGHPRITCPKEETYFFLRWNYTDFRMPGIPDARMKEWISSAESYVDIFDHIAAFTKQREGGDVFLEKTPEHAIVLDHLLNTYPRSKFVSVVRDPRDAFLSARRNPELDDWTLGNYCEDWRQCVRNIMRHLEDPRVFSLTYERLCRNPDRVVEAMMTHVGLESQPRQLEPDTYGDSTDLSGREGHKRLNEKISDDTVGDWKKELSRVKIKMIKNLCIKEMKELGYKL